MSYEKEASSKNNANTYLVRWGSSAGKGIIFLFVYRDDVIVFVKADAGISVQFSVPIVSGLVFRIIWFGNAKASAIAGTMYFGVMANKK
ncbi:hypothetical protein B6A10_06525 [Flavobacterium sp. L1I52]|uniref:Uncharacterized protein n=1 Tax=Flavobacterium pokkalii TaxID=1940408 RepID=A0ABR7UPK9_9FLAO|nr:hypothetical protein [Flavobacterium pokkalii]MBD0724830.1 hypothetical protein [Flavobacterium pokkalii]